MRPHFFEGVASVVSRLFLHVGSRTSPCSARRTTSSSLVIKRMTQDLGFWHRDQSAAPTMREADGLAMSSRNAYLSAEERAQGRGHLPRAMTEAAAGIEAGERISATAENAQQTLIAAGFTSVDYIAVRRADTLAPFGGDTAPAGVTGRLLIAARMGKTRLIDNMAFARK